MKPDANGVSLKQKTKRELQGDIDFLRESERLTRQELHILESKFEKEKKAWQVERSNRELDLRATIVRASAQLIESLARMVGGPGF